MHSTRKPPMSSIRSMLSARARECAKYLEGEIKTEKIRFYASDDEVFVSGGETNLTITVHEYSCKSDGTNYSMEGVVVRNEGADELKVGYKVKMDPSIFPGKEVYKFIGLDDFRSVQRLALKFFIE